MDTPETCPVCHGPNECGIALGKTTCWCFEQTIPQDVLAKVPDDQRDRACVCRNCAESAEKSGTAAAPQTTG